MKGLKALLKSIPFVGMIIFILHICSHLMGPSSGVMFWTVIQIAALFGLATLNYTVLIAIITEYINEKHE